MKDSMNREKRSLIYILIAFIVSYSVIITILCYSISNSHCSEDDSSINDPSLEHCYPIQTYIGNMIVSLFTYMLPVVAPLIIHYQNNSRKELDTATGTDKSPFSQMHSDSRSDFVMCVLSRQSGQLSHLFSQSREFADNHDRSSI